MSDQEIYDEYIHQITEEFENLKIEIDSLGKDNFENSQNAVILEQIIRENLGDSYSEFVSRWNIEGYSNISNLYLYSKSGNEVVRMVYEILAYPKTVATSLYQKIPDSNN